MGLKNVHLRGKTNTPNEGVDITADEEYQAMLGHEKRIWIFQCKHTKYQIDRKDILEVPILLKKFQADRYGLFYSEVLSPATLDRIATTPSTLSSTRSTVSTHIILYPLLY